MREFTLMHFYKKLTLATIALVTTISGCGWGKKFEKYAIDQVNNVIENIDWINQTINLDDFIENSNLSRTNNNLKHNYNISRYSSKEEMVHVFGVEIYNNFNNNSFLTFYSEDDAKIIQFRYEREKNEIWKIEYENNNYPSLDFIQNKISEDIFYEEIKKLNNPIYKKIINKVLNSQKYNESDKCDFKYFIKSTNFESACYESSIDNFLFSTTRKTWGKTFNIHFKYLETEYSLSMAHNF